MSTGTATNPLQRLLSVGSQLRTYAEFVLLPVNVWGTKGFQFWTFLSLLLTTSNCSRILELGSGRSTITLAEYAHFRKVKFISIETSPRWFNKTRFELRWLGVSDSPVRLLEWDPTATWYKIEQFRKTVGDEGSFDFAFIDGPNERNGKSRGIRDNALALAEIRRCIYDADIVIVDDVHRRHILDSVDAMLGDPDKYEKSFYDYSVIASHSNTLCICVRKASRISVELAKIQSILDLPLYATLERADCPED